jgi:hypothetical protein
VVAGKILLRHHVGANGRGVRRRRVTHPVKELRLGNRALLHGCHHRLASSCVAL